MNSSADDEKERGPPGAQSRTKPRSKARDFDLHFSFNMNGPLAAQGATERISEGYIPSVPRLNPLLGLRCATPTAV